MLPTRKRAVRGYRGHPDGRIRAYLVFAIARKFYRCAGCGGEIWAGSPHVLLRYQRVGPYDHHHYHEACAPELSEPEAIPPHKADRGEVSRRARRKRRK